MPSIVLTTTCTVLLLVGVLLLFMQFYSMKSNKHSPPAEDTRARPAEEHPPLPRVPPPSEPPHRSGLQEGSRSGELPEGDAPCTSRIASIAGEIASVSHTWPTMPAGPGLVVSPRARQIPGPARLPPLIHAQSRYELEQEYERGMHTRYDQTLGAIHFTGMQVVMNTPAEVELAFHVCKRQIRTALCLQGLERAPTLTDIHGIVIGREATAAWGLALKEYLEEMCIKVDNDTYLLAHYNSQAPRPGQDQLQETIRRIQFMTSAAIYHFQSNIFDTREGAMVFLQRMRAVYRV